MRENFDFSKSVPNPYVKGKRSRSLSV